ncbi:MAG TPA: hypothetical protein VJ797_15680 [Burkholderiales bacterium]|nr:hypothetical protein [Burkholderiales bacterium]
MKNLLWLTLLPAIALAQEIEVKGVPFGASEATIQKTVKGAGCGTPPRGSRGDRWCHVVQGGTYAGAPAQIFFTLYNDSMQSAHILFSPSDYDAIVDALAIRHGPAHRTDVEKLTTRIGAVYENTITRWKIVDVLITARRYSYSIDKGSVTLETTAGRVEEAIRARKVAPERAKDL